MSFLQVFVIFILMIFMIFVGIVANCLYTRKDTDSIWSCFGIKESPTDDVPQATEGSNKKLCEFEGESVFNKMIFNKKDNTLVTEQPDNMTCDECSDYIYKATPKTCSDIGYDKELQASGTVIGVCTASYKRKGCPSKILDQK